jgi:hypothetical protein
MVARAYRLACIRLRKEFGTQDWEILSSLYWLKKGVKFTTLWREFNNSVHPHKQAGNSWVYNSVNRLISNGLVFQTFSKAGHRVWTITAAGIAAINRANALALEILKEMEE